MDKVKSSPEAMRGFFALWNGGIKKGKMVYVSSPLFRNTALSLLNVAFIVFQLPPVHQFPPDGEQTVSDGFIRLLLPSRRTDPQHTTSILLGGFLQFGHQLVVS